MAQFRIGNNDYSTERMDAVTQFHVSRRIGPLIAELAPVFALQMRVEDFVSVLMSDIKWSTDLLKSVAKELSKMDDVELNYVLSRSLSKVVRHEMNPSTGEVAARVSVWNTSANKLQYSDVTMPQMIQMVWHVLRENLEDFSLDLPSASSG